MIDVTAIPSYTDAQLLAAFRYGLLQLAVSQSVSIAGRTVQRSQLSEVKETIKWLEDRIAAAGGSSGIALVTLNTVSGNNNAGSNSPTDPIR